tara:strand:- start:2459 stop:2764 length:306 start_codon:yes stop_codon:yes gene_type:complete
MSPEERINNLLSDSYKFIADLKHAKQDLANGDCVYHVHIISHWADYDEPGVEMKDKDPDGLVERAKKEFQRINHRTDFQARVIASIEFPNGVDIKWDWEDK